MVEIRNIDKGSRGIRTSGGVLVMVEPGETVDLDVSDEELDDASDWFALADDAEGEALAGMKVDALKALAESEGIDLGDATRKADIIAAIELAREAND